MVFPLTGEQFFVPGGVPVAGAVLIGGRSTRMGRDKCFVEYEGVPLLVRAVSRLVAAGAQPVAAVGTNVDHERVASCVDVIVPDAAEFPGPFGGLVAALTWSPMKFVFVLGVDLAEVRTSTIVEMCEVLARDRVGAVVGVGPDGVQPVCSAWDTTGPVLEFALAFARRESRVGFRGVSLRKFMAEMERHGSLTKHRIVSSELHNVNSPSDIR